MKTYVCYHRKFNEIYFVTPNEKTGFTLVEYEDETFTVNYVHDELSWQFVLGEL